MPEGKVLIPWLLSIAAICAGLWQYVDKTAQSNREPFLRAQLALVIETSEVVSTLATATDSDKWNVARARFWVLYYGPLAIFEDKAILDSMVEIGKLLPRPGTPVPALPYSVLRTKVLRLDQDARDLILRAWRLKPSDLGLETKLAN